MHAMKNRVSRKFSRFFPDSSPHNPDQQPQVRPCIEQEKSWSSLLSFSLPSLSFDRFKSSSHQDGLRPHGSHKFDRACGNYEILSDEEYCDHGTNGKLSFSKKQHNNTIVDDDNSSSARGRGCVPDVFEDAAEKFASEKSMPMPNLNDDSLFISPNLYEFFDSSLPNIVKGCQWTLLYSSARDGISLRTLIRKSTNLSGPCLLITGDKKGAVFGGLLECPLKPTAKRKYQGTNQTFIFTTLYGEPRLFRPTGANRYFYLCLNDMLALGGGGNFALCLDEDLLTGSSGACETFGNLCLAHDQEFDLKNVELWGFMHASRYLG